MGRKRSPAEKRLRGFLSGDPSRIARTVDRTCGVADPEVHAHMAANLDALIAATQDVPLPDDRRVTLDRYIAQLKHGQNATPNCPCKTFRGDPGLLHGKVSVTKQVNHAGWREISVICENCARRFVVTEDNGYHVPQYSWRGL